MTTYKLSRYEKSRSHTGEITSIFLAVNVTDEDENSLTQEYFLTEEERDAVLPDTDIAHDTLVDIIETVAAKGVVRLEKEVATRPQPPIIADSTVKESFVLNENRITGKVAAIKSEALEAVIE